MAKEIERKFLVDQEKWKPGGKKIEMLQAYLAIENGKVVRVRIADKHAFLTIKGNLSGITRDEFEYTIPKTDAEQMLNMKLGYSIEKTRYVQDYGGKVWEIDVFKGHNKGLIVAEIELESENEEFERPDWLGEEVSTLTKYYNFNLSHSPYETWQ